MILEVKGVSKVFSGRGKSRIVANDDLTFSLKEGEIFGLLGHNGAGKTTLVNQIIGLITPTSGEINLLGKSVLKSPARARSICSLQPQSQLPLGFLTPAQAVTIMGKMRAGQGFDVKRRMERLFEKLDIGRWANTEGQRLSGGVRRLTAFCMAVIVPGNLVILDEPTNDVDPVRRRYLWQIIREITSDGTSVILVTHNVLEAEKAVDRVAILHQGKFLAKGTPSAVKNSVSNKMRLEVSLTNELSQIEIPTWAVSSQRKGTRLFFSLPQSSVLAAIDWARGQAEQGRIIDYSLSPTTIEDVYVELTSEKELLTS
ncbi:MAG: ABC transporter ATP-binding protein [Halanaerobiales bacterium]|nr:ABC transporter ATP-binding protein [Halanaerobiales bacterium]